MIEEIVSPTRILKFENLTAPVLAKIVLYCGGEDARISIIHDNAPHDSRDAMINDFRKIRDANILNRVFPDPKVSDIMDMTGILKGKQINVIVGIGGGSSLDSAKAVAAIISNGGDLNDYLGPKATKVIKKHTVKLILIPTTAGTGSEVTKFGVYTARSGRKYTLNNAFLQPDIAILSTKYTYSLPSSVTASTAFDALSHALETLWNRNATPLSDQIATESAVHILRWIEAAYDSSVSGAKEGRAEMLEGACMAGVAFNMTGTAAVHALSFILSEQWHVPHSVACAFFLEDIMELNISDVSTKEKLIRVARALFGEKADDELIERLTGAIARLKRKFKLPFRFSDLGIDLKVDQINGLFNKSLDDPKMKNNIVAVDQGIVLDIIKSKI